MNVFIVESPAKAKTIAKYLGKDFRVVASCGHVRDLPRDRIGIAHQDGTFTAEYEVTKRSVVDRIQTEINRAHCVWLATDGDREGEGIAAHLLACLRIPEGIPVRRAVFHEITPTALKEAVERPRALSTTLVDAQNSRRLLDRLVGYQVSPVLWKALGQKDLSAGRVQSSALHLLVDRQHTIDSFVPQVEATASATFSADSIGEFRADYVPSSSTSSPRLDEAWMRHLEPYVWNVAHADAHEDIRHPAPPFITSTLQQEAGQRLRLSAKQVMRAAQSLYEAGHITYMRTDSTALSQTAQQATLGWIRKELGETYAHPRLYRPKAAHAQEAHEAIRPTRIDVTSLDEATSVEKNLYRLIWKRTVASQMAPAKDLVWTVTLHGRDPATAGLDPIVFVSRARKNVFDGFRRIIGSEDDTAEDVPAVDRYERWSKHLVAGTPLQWTAVEVVSQPPFPPRHFTEATFVRALEEKGIGRPSTYEPTLATLEARGYLDRKTAHISEVPVVTLTWGPGLVAVDRTQETKTRKETNILLPSPRGASVCRYLHAAFHELTDPEYTAHMEAALDAIADGTKSWREVLATYQTQLRARIQSAEVALQHTTAEQRQRELPAERTPKSGESTLLGDHPLQPGWTVRLYPQGRFGPFVMSCPPVRARQKPQFASVPPALPLSTVTLTMALEWLQKAAKQREGKKGPPRKGGRPKKGTSSPSTS